jgi:hypothetical protein
MEKKVWHIQIDGISWCQLDMVKMLGDNVYFEIDDYARTLRKLQPEMGFSMCCSSTDRKERERFVASLNHYLHDVKIVEGECKQWGGDFYYDD